MKIVLNPGDTLHVQLDDTDGEFIIAYGPEALTINSDLPDTSGRVGEIYRESFGVRIPDAEARASLDGGKGR